MKKREKTIVRTFTMSPLPCTAERQLDPAEVEAIGLRPPVPGGGLSLGTEVHALDGSVRFFSLRPDGTWWETVLLKDANAAAAVTA